MFRQESLKNKIENLKKELTSKEKESFEKIYY